MENAPVLLVCSYQVSLMNYSRTKVPLVQFLQMTLFLFTFGHLLHK